MNESQPTPLKTGPGTGVLVLATERRWQRALWRLTRGLYDPFERSKWRDPF